MSPLLVIGYLVGAALTGGVTYAAASRARYMEDEHVANAGLAGALALFWPPVVVLALFALLSLIGYHFVRRHVHAAIDHYKEFIS